VDDYIPTGLIAAIAQMNQGLDFRESELRAATDFCIGGTVDLSRGVESEAALAARKVRAGAQFLMTQPVFSAEHAIRYLDAYSSQPGESPPVPVFIGLQILEQDGVIFSSVPEPVRSALETGRSGVDLALQLYNEFQSAGIQNIYLIPPIRRGGARNYAAAREFLEAVN
jgi:homocysteine S-methyltransferase